MPLKKACFWKSTMPMRPIRREGSHSNERMRSWGSGRVSGEEEKVLAVERSIKKMSTIPLPLGKV